ncbi:hypothetical protein [Flavobacterium sp. N1994]|uniref:hypothetical protein n=1 Tax=Flavobacterium sp. N1994 TaxID=2986827 RepID=UPI0022215F8F|nr:hypothetical protein [Flavobacterium sp. N1994]
MKNGIFLIIMLLLFSFDFYAQVNPNSTYVNGYTKSNGTYVQGYYRTTPNATINDNYSTYPNVNPYTGQQGTVQPTYSTPSTNSYYSTPTYSTPSTTNSYYYSTPTPTYTTPSTTNSYYSTPTYSTPTNSGYYYNRQ